MVLMYTLPAGEFAERGMGGDIADHKTRGACRWVCCRGRKLEAGIDAIMLCWM